MQKISTPSTLPSIPDPPSAAKPTVFAAGLFKKAFTFPSFRATIGIELQRTIRKEQPVSHHLCYRFLTDSQDPRCFYLLGYPLRLSPTEGEILHCLLERESIHPETLRHLPSRTLSRNCLSVHVHAINQKAYEISGRRLVLCLGDEYRLSPNM